MQGELWGWTCFYIGVAAVAFGSSYYHLKPNDARLVWDRLPVNLLSVFLHFLIIMLLSAALILTQISCLTKLDDHCIHFDHCNLYHWKDWWAKGNNIHHAATFGWSSEYIVLEASTIFPFFVFQLIRVCLSLS